MARVAVIGTGTMGTAMARLLHAGMEVDVWSRHPVTAAPLVAEGANGYATSEAGAAAAPLAAAIADRWRGLVTSGSSGLDVSAARKGLGPDPSRPNTTAPTGIADDPK